MASCAHVSLPFVRSPSHVPVTAHSGRRPGSKGDELWAAAARPADGVSLGLHRIRVPRHREAWLPVHFPSPCRLPVCCMESYTAFPQVTHLTNLLLKNHKAIWGTTAWSRVCDQGRGTRAALTPRNGFAVPPQGP